MIKEEFKARFEFFLNFDDVKIIDEHKLPIEEIEEINMLNFKPERLDQILTTGDILLSELEHLCEWLGVSVVDFLDDSIISEETPEQQIRKSTLMYRLRLVLANWFGYVVGKMLVLNLKIHPGKLLVER